MDLVEMIESVRIFIDQVFDYKLTKILAVLIYTEIQKRLRLRITLISLLDDSLSMNDFYPFSSSRRGIKIPEIVFGMLLSW